VPSPGNPGRGEPLAEFAYEPFAQAEIGRLQEARLAALEDRIEADLALGADGELVGEIESLVAANPLAERLRGQLMLALYRSGRRSGGLPAGERAVAGGAGPGAGPTTARARARDPRTRRLPGRSPRCGRGSRRPGGGVPVQGAGVFDRADAEFFCGRERLVADLLARLVESPLAGIIGSSGVGKSSLLRAGVLPALSAGSLPGSERWRQVLLRPGTHPGAELSRALAGEPPGEVVGRQGSVSGW
jgi:Bacterial transcriptional activator domain